MNPNAQDDVNRQIQTEIETLNNQPAIAEKVIAFEGRTLQILKSHGYAFAKAGERKIIGDRNDATIAVEYRIESGPRILFGGVTFNGAKRTKISYLNRLIPFTKGDVFKPDELALLNSRLNETRLFDRSSATLMPLSEAQREAEDDVTLDVAVNLEERPINTVALGGSISTAEGLGATTEWTRRNLARRGDVLEARLTLATLEQQLEIEWRRPNEFGYGRGLVLNAALSDEMTDAFDRQAILFGAGYEVVEGPDFSWTYGGTIEFVSEESKQIERSIQLATVYASARIDRSNDLLNPTRGWRAEVRVSPHQSFGDSDVSFLRTTGQVRGYYPLRDNLTLAARLRSGAAIGAAVEDLPSDDRFYAGGGGSVRGYSFQAIGPRTKEGEPLGGRALLDGALELRWQRSVKLGFVGFVDAGSVSPSERPSIDDIRYGAGLGVRYATPAGPIRFDIAVPIDKSRFDDPLQFYISIGQAF